MKLRIHITLFALSLAALLAAASARASNDTFIIVQSTTSTQNSGLLDAILPRFESTSGIDVRVVAVGTGQAIRNATNGDGDVLLVHARDAEEQFVQQGWGVERLNVMYNDFVLLGPDDDPANIAGGSDIIEAMTAIAVQQKPFVSRGDDSGTHKAELRLWKEAGIDARADSGSWYRETGSGMGASLNVAVGMNAYVLTDRATWIAFGNRGNLQILVEGDERLFNQYGVILVNPERHPNVKAIEAQQFINWLTGVDGQQAIAEYQIDGEQLFFPNAVSQSMSGEKKKRN